MIRNDRRLLSALTLNLLVVIMEAHSIFVSLFIKKNLNIQYFMYYTHISSVFAAVASLLIIVEISREITNPSNRSRSVFRYIRYVSVCMQTLTMLVVVFILFPSDLRKGTFRIRSYANVGEYFLCPILSLISMTVFGDYRGVTKRDALTALVPTALYALVMALLNAFRIVDGPYDFLRVHNQSIYMSVFWTVVIICGAYAINRLLILLARKFNQRYVSETE